MRKLVHKLRQQPEEVRVYLLYGLTAGVAVILFVLWVYSFGGSTEEPVVTENQNGQYAPVDTLKGSLIEGYNILKGE